MNIELLLLIPTAAINVLMGLLVLQRAPHRVSTRYFAISAFFVSLWAIGDFIFLSAHENALVRLGSILYYVAPMFTSLLLVFFARSFPGNTPIPLKVRIWWTTVTAALALLIITKEDFLTQTVTTMDQGLNMLTVNPLNFTVYALFFAVCFGTSYVYLFKSLQHSYGYRRNQVRYSLAGIFLSSALATISNLILPIFVTSEFIWLGPLFTMSYVLATSIAIVKHRLFDIRLVVARSVAYILLLTTLALLYALTIFAFTSLFLDGTNPWGIREIVYILLAVFLSFTFQPLKRFFDRVTNRIFYRDAYDSQKVLDELGVILVNAISAKNITSNSLNILQRAIKPTFMCIVLTEHMDGHHERIFSVGSKPNNLDVVMLQLQNAHEALVIQDELLNQTTGLFKSLQEKNVAIAARLQTSKETVGFMLLGYKSSGNVYGDQDINLIKIAVDELAVAIQNALRFEEIQDFNKTLQQRVDEATAQLRESNQKLQQLDKAKDEFISMASHQLRTPLTSVKGYLSMAIDGDAGKLNPAQRKLLEEAYSGTQRMVYLIGDFLNVSRIQTGKFVLESKPVQLAKIVQEEIDQLKTTLSRRNITVEYHRPSNFPLLQLDENKIRQVVMNFIDNAIFYSHPSSTVRVELYSTASEARFEVHDTGIGVPEYERHKLFSKFFRAENARRVRPDGTGIGLFMAKKVITEHRGSVIFESKEGQGSTFGFSLPLPGRVLKDQAK